MSTPPPWAPTHEVDAALAHQLLRHAMPDYDGPAPTPLGVGWDNTAFRAGPWVLRFPRRPLAVPLIEAEAAVLPELAALPLQLPQPALLAPPSAAYPYPWLATHFVPGDSASDVPWSLDERRSQAEPLARFLAALHRVPTTLAGLPDDTLHRADLASRVEPLDQALTDIEALPCPIEAARALYDLSTLPPDAGEAVCHGDLYSRHLVIQHGQLTGVIDWGDVHRGDPAVDLMVAWLVLPPDAHAQFRRAYGPISDITWSRARFRALFSAVMVVHYGDKVGDTALATAGRLALPWIVDGL